MNIKAKRDAAVFHCRKAIERCLKAEKHILQENFIKEVMRTQNVTERTAREYIKAAYNILNIKLTDSAQLEL